MLRNQIIGKLDQNDVAEIYEHLKKLANDGSKLDGVLEPLGAEDGREWGLRRGG